MNVLVNRLQQLTAISFTILAAHSSQAAIIGSSIQGQAKNQPETSLGLKIIEPPAEGLIIRNFEKYDENGNFLGNPNPDPSRDLVGIIERQGVVLSKPVEVWNEFGNNPPSKPNTTIAKDTLVSSYFFYANPPGAGEPRFEWSGQILFDAPIFGVIAGFGAPWGKTHQLVGLDTDYQISTALDRGQDLLHVEDNVLTFYISASSGKEPFRVITSGTPTVPVPEPLTILGSGIALGFGVIFQKIKRK